jgi:Restriction endonuclease
VGNNYGAGAAIAAPFQAVDVEAIEHMETPAHSTRRSLSVRIRFEVFKRDDFTCSYCGRRSPDVVLEVDHIVPVVAGGQDDPINLTTSCWECNRGKSAVLLNQVITGEDPHDRAVMLLERERQLEEYNTVLEQIRERREAETWALVRHWKTEQGYTDHEDLTTIARPDYQWLFNALEWCPREVIMRFMDLALQRRMTKNLKYVAACARNWRYEHQANTDTRGDDYVG